MSTQELTTTSYAILGLLAIRPWTTYELATQMERTLNRMWPRARSKLYEEPKKLVRLRLAVASKGTVGKRPRTVYAITRDGRRALAAWLKTPAAGVFIESEALVKLFFADSGKTRDVRATLEATREWALSELAAFADVFEDYLDGTAAFPQRAAVNFLGARLMVDFYNTVIDWTDAAQSTIASWPDEPKNAEPDWDSLREMLRRAKRVEG
jgi:DNA-binding PadR family transcriptional regulator